MKAYKDLNKTQECEDGDPVAVLATDNTASFAQQRPEKRPVFRAPYFICRTCGTCNVGIDQCDCNQAYTDTFD